MTTSTSYKPSFVRFWDGHVKTLVELIWNYPYVYCFNKAIGITLVLRLAQNHGNINSQSVIWRTPSSLKEWIWQLIFDQQGFGLDSL